jgi:hypothetical protein
VAQRDQLRASDDDRERVAAILRDAHAEGRLSRDEFDERLDSTYQARTYQDLNGLLTDLPVNRGQLAKPESTSPAIRPSPSPIRQKARRAARKTLNVFWWIYGVAVAINVVVWGSLALFLPGDAPPFWPIFVAGPWGVVMLFAELAYRSGESRR